MGFLFKKAGKYPIDSNRWKNKTDMIRELSALDILLANTKFMPINHFKRQNPIPGLSVKKV